MFFALCPWFSVLLIVSCSRHFEIILRLAEILRYLIRKKEVPQNIK